MMCSKCGKNPVSTATPTAKICDSCAYEALVAAMKEAHEGFPCPRCGTKIQVPLFERYECPNCGYVEEVED
jgi:predicted RNA-binding Zn-ribbon protein involved in translation (DUF1610 family)